MANITNKIDNFEMTVNESFIKKANELEPKLYKNIIVPEYIVNIAKKNDDWIVLKKEPAYNSIEIPKGNSVCFDFGNHYVGYITIHLKSIGSPPDAPAHIRIKLGEILDEIGEQASDYNGSISSSWIQEEFIHIDILPTKIRFPRRYAFRYIEIKVLDTSPKYQLVLEHIECETVTSANRSKVEALPDNTPDNLKKMDNIALKTMEDCMQKVFEDGPKRDRRLWIGDLRLQALTNYVTFHNNDLVKRCLYLFAGLTQNEGHVGACLFIEPKLQVDDTSLFDYGLFFISCLYDYYIESKDIELLKELWDTAYNQALIAMKRVDNSNVVKDSNDWWCFIDWNDKLNKQASAQGVLLYTLKQAYKLAEALKNNEQKQKLSTMIERLTNGAKNILWDENQGFFVSGKEKQISWASQIWLVLADVFEIQKNQQILKNLFKKEPDIKMVTPYMYHHLVDVLIQNDMKQEALQCIENYWGQMVEDGADCFYELYDPQNKNVSPYGSRIINSYCHAWSCTPSYFIRKYFIKEYR